MIEIVGLVKSFGQLNVLDKIDLQIKRKRVTAVVGPNASGKTTLIKCILGLTRQQAGTIIFDGKPLDGAWDYRRHIGYMPQIARFPDHLKAREILMLLKELRDQPGAKGERLCEAFQLDSELDKPLGTLSGGTRQKINAILAFLFDPDVLFLDEPTAGLDPVAGSLLKDWIMRERDDGKTIVLTSHIMSEIEELADDLAFLVNGRVSIAGSAVDIKNSTGEDKLERAIAQIIVGTKD
ncbi:MAG: ABC transporter ATP-binding protein [Bacteroidetes bacterium]|nr:ABC transporter ATP-binding protein [Bacteroidota bacterium]